MHRIFSLPRSIKGLFALLIDVAACLLTVAISYYLRLNELRAPIGNEWISYIVPALFVPLTFHAAGLYSSILRFTGWGTYERIFKTCAVYGIGHFLLFTVFGFQDVPRSIGIIQPAVFTVAVASWRFLANLIVSSDSRRRHGPSRHAKRVMIYGAGNAGRQLSAGLAMNADYKVVCFVDDDPKLTGTMLNGLRVYAPNQLVERMDSLDIDDLLIALPSAPRLRRREIIESLQGAHVSVRMLPSVDQLASGQVAISDLRQPEIEDLLGRDPVPPDPALMAATIAGRVVMVTGAGGSIGSELCRQALHYGPRALILVELSEFNLYTIHNELNALNAKLPHRVERIIPILIDVQDSRVVNSVMTEHKPETVFHAAAYKHVPLAEVNACATIANNVLSTQNMANAARDHSVRHFVLISTDKAVRPTNIMGASKRLAEQILQNLARTSSDTIFTMVRFGNVLGSSGSVVPMFRAQIKAGGPLTVTHPEVIRFFMTIPEASQLVIQASALAKGGDVFVLDMGPPVSIVELAKRMVELSGLTVSSEKDGVGDIDIEFIGLRPGEKLFEELLIGGGAVPTLHPRIMKTSEAFLDKAELEEVLYDLRQAKANFDDQEILEILKRGVPNFDHRPNGSDV